MADEKIEYYFQAAKALGAKGITRELSEDAAKRLGPIADKHEIMIGFHNHTQLKPTTYDGDMLSYGKYLGINFDIGHYVAGTNQMPIPLIEKHKDRILSLHLKDRKLNNGPNMPFGQGDTPVAAVLQYMKKNQLTFPADIELEYPVPDGLRSRPGNGKMRPVLQRGFGVGTSRPVKHHSADFGANRRARRRRCRRPARRKPDPCRGRQAQHQPQAGQDAQDRHPAAPRAS